jgi:nucleotide-binding universal stress UspA family protein
MLFPCVITGIDGTRSALEAARQAARLVDPGGRLILVTVEDELDALAGRWAGRRFVRDDPVEWTHELRLAELRRRIDASLAFAAEGLDATSAIETRHVEGRPWETLRELADAEGASLLAIGTHGGSRARGIVLGRTATTLAHESATSVLVARPPFDPKVFPFALAVGYDGSPQSERALDVASAIADRRPPTQVRVVTCRPVPPGLALEVAAQRGRDGFVFETDSLLPDEGLVEVSESVDLLVVGSRGLQGFRALGSTSEHVVHRAASSVLVVRE